MTRDKLAHLILNFIGHDEILTEALAQSLSMEIMKAYAAEKEQPLTQINPAPVVNSQQDISIRQGKTEIIIRHHE